MVAAARKKRDQWKAEGEILGEDKRLDQPPIFALGGVFSVDEAFPHT
jgi:hypothetical protein